MKYIATRFLVVLLAVTALADDITLIDGKNLRNAKVIRREDNSVVVSHSGGIVTLTPADFPPDSVARYFPEVVLAASNAAEEAQSEPHILHFNTLSQRQKKEVIEDLTARYVLIPDVGLVEILDADGFRSLNASELGYRYIDDTISQTIGADEYLISDNTLKIRVPGNTNLVDDSPIAGIAKDDGTYTYVTVMGAPRRIRAYEIVPATLAQIEDFVEAMKTNFIFEARITADLACDQCNGQGYIPESRTVNAGLVACRYCKGRGTIEQRERENPGSSTIRFGEGNTYKYSYKPCSKCGGTAQQQSYVNQTVKTPCRNCGGKGTVVGRTTVDVTW